MSKISVTEWIRTLVPVFLLGAAIIASHVRMTSKVQENARAIEQEKERVTLQDIMLRTAQSDVTRMTTDIMWIKDGVKRNQQSLDEILKRLPRNGP